MEKQKAVGVLCAIACECLYGTGTFFTKTATREVSVMTVLGWRFLLAFALMSVLVALRILKVDYKGKSLRKLLKIAVLFPVIYFAAETVGIACTTVSESATLLACIPVASLIASAIVLGKKPKKAQVFGVCVTLAGVLMTVLDVGIEASFSVLGYAMLALAVAVYAVSCAMVEGASEFTGTEITYAMIAVGCVAFGAGALLEAAAGGALAALFRAPAAHPAVLRAVLYQAVGCTIGAFFLSNAAIALIGVNRAASFVGLSTVVSILSGVLILGERFSLFQSIGAAIIIGGVYIANRQGNGTPAGLKPSGNR